MQSILDSFAWFITSELFWFLGGCVGYVLLLMLIFFVIFLFVRGD